MAILALIAAISSLGLGIVVLWANPNRLTNQAFAILGLNVSVHLFFVYLAVNAGIRYDQDPNISPIPPLRAGLAVSMLIPWIIWVLREAIITKESNQQRLMRRSMPWFIFGVLLATICFTNYYFPPDSFPNHERKGPGYAIINFILAIVYLFLIGQSWFQMRQQKGIRRIEMQFFVLNSAIVALVAVALALASQFWQISVLKILTHFMIIVGCGSTAWAVSYYHIFDVREVFLSIGQRLTVVGTVVVGVTLVGKVLEGYMPNSVSIVCSVAVVSSTAFWMDRKTRNWMGLGGERELASMRRAVIELARTQPHPNRLEALFEAWLCRRCNCGYTALFWDNGKAYSAGELCFSKIRLGLAALLNNGWATPESILRRRCTPSLSDLGKFLSEQSLGLIVAVPKGSPTPTLLIAFGTKANEWPYTYPEVLRLQNVAELMDNILTRARFTMQVVEQAKIEHLVMMSRGLAHDINNLITPISSFLVYTDTQYPEVGPERDVQTAASRSVRVMAEYVREALFFAERLTPRWEQVDIIGIFKDVRALTAERAASCNVILEEVVVGAETFIADSVLVQRALVNLVGNAIDASCRGGTVILTSISARVGWISLRVGDQGSGIPSENLERIFDPYFTTKKYGDETRGFGLGLTICQKIAQLHCGKITVDSQPGRGTTVMIELPITQPG